MKQKKQSNLSFKFKGASLLLTASLIYFYANKPSEQESLDYNDVAVNEVLTEDGAQALKGTRSPSSISNVKAINNNNIDKTAIAHSKKTQSFSEDNTPNRNSKTRDNDNYNNSSDSNVRNNREAVDRDLDDSNSFTDSGYVASNTSRGVSSSADSSGSTGLSPDSGSSLSNGTYETGRPIGNEDFGVQGTDTTGFTEVSTGSSSSTYTAPDMNCSSNKAEGVHGTTFQVTITCSEQGLIKYCIQTGGGECDPFSSSTTYTGPVNIGPIDDTYKLSFYAENEGGIVSTEVIKYEYILSTVPPDLSINFPKKYVQTTQLPLSNSTQSNDFGKADHYYYQINFKSNDPTSSGLNWTCDDIINNHSVLNSPSPVVIQNAYDVSGLTAGDQINQSVDISRLTIGDNYVVTVLEDRARGLISCQTENIKLNDFFMASFTGTGPGNRMSSFTGYGHFQSVPNSQNFGELENIQLPQVLEAGFWNIIF